jgi:hypothetical protein
MTGVAKVVVIVVILIAFAVRLASERLRTR